MHTSSNDDLREVLQRLLAALARPAEQHRLMQTIVEQAARLADGSAALLVPEPDEHAILRVQLGIGPLAECEGELVPAEGSFAGGAFLDGAPRASADLATDARAYRARAREVAVGPACAVPLSRGSRHFAVLLLVREPRAPAFEPPDLEVLRAAAAAFADALTNVARYHQARDGHAAIADWRRLQRLTRWEAAYQDADRADRRVVFRWDARADLWEWSPSLAHLIGHPPEQFGSTVEQWLGHVREQDRAHVRSEIEGARQDAAALAVRCWMLHATGSFRTVVLRAPEPRDPGTVRVGVLDDVTGARVELTPGAPPAGSEYRSPARAAELVHALRHEINNPLSVVIGQLQLLENDPVVDRYAHLHDALQAMRKESARLDQVVRWLARLERNPDEPLCPVSHQPGGRVA